VNFGVSGMGGFFLDTVPTHVVVSARVFCMVVILLIVDLGT
jgi:hypothetical protein